MEKCNLNLKKYIGTKVVEARPMNEIDAEYIGYTRKNSDHHEWREGYHVRYTNQDGSFYDSWSPKDVFEEAYRIADSFKDRIKIELSDIADKLIKLRHFLYVKEHSVDTVGVHQYSLMVAQEHIMQSYKDVLEKNGLICSGTSPDESLVEIVEIPSHKFFIAGQFHPEFKSRPDKPAPLFSAFIESTIKI